MGDAFVLLTSIFAQRPTSNGDMGATPIVLEPDGDLLLRAGSLDSAADGTTWTTFQVCSAALRRASPV